MACQFMGEDKICKIGVVDPKYVTEGGKCKETVACDDYEELWIEEDEEDGEID